MNILQAFKSWKNRALNDCTENGGHLPTLQEAFESGYKSGYDQGRVEGWSEGHRQKESGELLLVPVDTI